MNQYLESNVARAYRIMKKMLSEPNVIAMVRGVCRLHSLMQQGNDDDSPEAESIRDATDAPWKALSQEERQFVRELSEDLFSLSEPAREVLPMTAEVTAILTAVEDARARGDGQHALMLLRHCAEFLAPAKLSYLRGLIWRDVGDTETAALFLRHATRLAPENGAYLRTLGGLSLTAPAAAEAHP